MKVSTIMNLVKHLSIAINNYLEPISDITWDEFRKDVGYAAFMNNP